MYVASSIAPTTECLRYCTELDINIEEFYYTIREENAASNPVIRLQFRRTQSPFTMTIFPVTVNEVINFTGAAEDFIHIPQIPEALATSGGC